MFKHIVMWKLNEDTSDQSKKESAEVIKSALEQLPPLISQIVSYEVGINLQDGDRTFDIVLISEFNNQNDFEIYRTHPDHIKAVETIRDLSQKAHFVDFISEQ